MEQIGAVFVLIMLILPDIFECKYCIKEITFDYGYGFYIKCDGLSGSDQKQFKSIYANKDTILELKQSNLTDFPIQSFKNFQNIRGLIIDNTTINLQFLHNLQSLESLNITNSRIDLNRIDFPLLTTLKRVILNGIDLRKFNVSLMRNFRNLESVDLNHNQLREFSNLTTLKELTIFRAAHNNLTELARNNFVAAKNKIKRLFFDYNQIKIIDSEIFGFLNDLEEICLNYNQLTKVQFVDLKKLQTIRVADNRLNRVELKNLPNLKELYLDNNRIENLHDWVILPNLKLLKLNRNNLTKVDELAKFLNLQILDLSNNYVDLHANLLINLTNLDELYLSNNQIKQIPVGLFKNQHNLTILDLSFNSLNIINNQSFSGLNNLISLNLSDNQLNNLNYDSIRVLHKLEILDLTGNRLTTFEYGTILTQLPSLLTIDLKSNQLSCNLLEDMLAFLESKHVSFSVNEKFVYDRENVAGITCVELQQNDLFTIIIIIILLICLIILCYFAVKSSIYYLKRRNYISDNFELL